MEDKGPLGGKAIERFGKEAHGANIARNKSHPQWNLKWMIIPSCGEEVRNAS
jgi:hypothetical protein